MINGKPKVRDGKNKKKEINYVSLSTYKKKYSQFFKLFLNYLYINR